MPKLEDYIEEIKPIFESHRLTNMGPVYKKFQHQLMEYLHVPQLSLFVNGHMALELAIQALGLQKEGGEVITTPFTFVSTTHAIVRNGLKPVFCDIKPDDYTMDPDKIEELITENTVAIIPVHVYGNLCDVEAIDTIAKKHNLKVIYDAAHAFGVTYKGIGVGNFGDASMFSFHATKVFNTVEGGAIAFSEESYRRKLHNLKNFGIRNAESVEDIGANAKLNEFCAAMGICNLRRMDECIEKRALVAKRYDERLGNVEGIRIGVVPENVTPNYSYYPIYVDKEVFGQSRDDIAKKLAEHDIYARKYFYPAVNAMECYRDIYDSSETPVALDASLNILTIPMYEELSIEEVDYICDVILDKR
jgi:dTDP-4-amino-4,6-dideoxygalactose transaminase